MFRILSQTDIDRLLRLRRWQALALFAAGITLGIALDHGEGFPPAAHAQAQALAPQTAAAGADCVEAAITRLTLRLACTLSSGAPLSN